MSKPEQNKPLLAGSCPVTKGLPTKMTESGFARACMEALGQATQGTKENGGRLPLAMTHLGRCLACRSKERPPEFEILSIEALRCPGRGEQKKVEDLMGTKQEGTCQCCGRKKMTVVRLHGDLVCSSCGNLYGAMANRPAAVKKAMAKLMPEVLAVPDGSDGPNSLTYNDARLVAILDGIAKALPDGCEDHSFLPDLVATLAGDYRALVIESRAYAEPSEEVVRAFELEGGATVSQAWGKAIRIAAELEDVQLEMGSMFSKDQLREICQLEIGMPPLEYVEGVLMPEREELRSVLAQIKATLNVDESGQVVEAVAQLTQAFDLYKQRAELLAAENSALANRISELEHRLSELVDWGELPEESRGASASPFMDPVREQLADFALKVLNGQVGIVLRDA